MKRIAHLFLTILCASGVLTLQGMHPMKPGSSDKDQGTMSSLIEVKRFSEPTAHNPRLGEVADRAVAHADQRQNVFDHAVAMAAVGMQQKPTRRLLDVVPGLNQLPKILWQTIIAPYLADDYAPKMFPVPLMPMYEGKLKGINKDRSRAVITAQKGMQVIDPLAPHTPLYALPGARPTFNTDGRSVACQKGDKIKVIALESGEELHEIKKRSESDAPFLFCDDVLLMADRNHEGNQPPAIKCFDVSSRKKDNNWYMEGSTLRSLMDKHISRAGLLAIQTTAHRVAVYNIKTGNKCFETDGDNFDLAADGSRIAVQHNNRIKIFDLNDKERKELFDQPGNNHSEDLLKLTKHNKVVFRRTNFRTIQVYDIASGQELIEVEGDESHLSPDEKLIAITKRSYERRTKEQVEQGRARKFFESHESYELYDIASKELVLQNNYGPFSFSPDSHYCFYANPNQTTTMVHLSSRETWILPGSNPVVSPDGRVCSLFRMNKAVRKNTPYGYLQRVYGSQGDCVLETIVVDLMHKKELARFKSESALASRAFACNEFSSNDLLEVSEHVMPDMPFGIVLKDPNLLRTLPPHKELFFDLAFFEDKKFQDARAHELTPEQSILLMLLEDIHQRNNGSPISLHDIALKERVSLEELQDTLGSFHPLIAKSLIKRYAIIDHTPEITKAFAKKSYWMNVAKKVTGSAAVVATIGALRWYLKKK